MGIKLNTTSGGSATINPTDGTSNVTVNVPNSSGTILVGPDVAYPSVRPSLNLDFANSRQLDTRITFSRNQTGTYYDGKTTAKAEENLVSYSNLFTGSGGWNIPGITSTQSAGTAPDGTNTLNSIVEDTSTGGHGLYKSISGNASSLYTASVYAQANTRSYITVQIATDGTANRYSVTVNLSTGAFVSAQTTGVPSQCSYSIQASGSMYRISVTSFNTSGTVSIILSMSDSANPSYSLSSPSYTGNGTSSIYLWGAQLEQRSTLTAYTPTTSSAITNYIPTLVSAPVNTPRFDYDIRPTLSGSGTVSGSTVTLPATFADGSTSSTDNGAYKGNITIAGTSYPIVSCYNRVITVTGTPTTGVQVFVLTNPNVGKPLGLLIEESRTNWLTYSSGFDNAIWGKFRAAITPGVIFAPDGTLTASKFVEDTSVSNTHVIRNDGFSYVNGTTYTATVYAKAGERPGFQMRMSGVAASEVSFNLTTGIIAGNNGVNVGASITAVGNGWYRCSVSYLYGTGGPVAIDLWNGSAVIYTGDGYSGIYIWGAQLEAGTFATSYIPTTSTTITRGADQASMTGTNFSSWYNQSQGSFYADMDSTGTTGSKFSGIYSYGADLTSYILLANSTSSVFQVGTSGFVSQANLSATLASPVKMAGSYAPNNFRGSFNGVLGTADTSGSLPNPVQLFIGWNQVNTQGAMCHIKKISYYPVALSSTELQAITSI